MIDLARLFAVLQTGHVEFIVVGGVAARAHGSLRVADTAEIVYARSDANITRLAKALSQFNPYPRGAVAKLPFAWAAETLHAGLNFQLQTTIGDVDLLGEAVGGGRYEDLLDHCDTPKIFGHIAHVISQPWLIRLKRATGRAQDFEAIAELELLQDLIATRE